MAAEKVTAMRVKKFASVWDALEDDREIAGNMKVRAELMIALQERVRREKGAQTDKAARPGITQPRLNDLLRGWIDKFSPDALVNLAIRAGLRVNLQVRKAA